MSLNEWVRYRDILKRLSQTAADEFRDAVWKKGGRWNAAGLGGIPRDELVSYAYALVTKYGEGSAAVACQLYDEIAELSGVSVPPAVPASTPSISEVAKAINGTIKASENEDYVSSTVGRLVKQVGQDTTMQNALRDGAEAAWIPSGDTCAFCIALASRGWQQVTQKTLKNGHAEHIHANCDCAYGVRFDSSFNVGGYDPDVYLGMYNEADGNINTMRRDFYAKNADEINAQKRQAYALRMQPKAKTERQELEAQARDVYLSRGGHDNLSASEASDRFDKLIGAQTDAQLRNYIKKHG
jgi:hypothetical protein